MKSNYLYDGHQKNANSIGTIFPAISKEYYWNRSGICFGSGAKSRESHIDSDNTQTYVPQPRMYAMKASMVMDETATKETLAIGEIEITANVSVNFVLE